MLLWLTGVQYVSGYRSGVREMNVLTKDDVKQRYVLKSAKT